MRQDIDKALQKLQAPPEHRGPRALPAPLEPISKKRGGKRVRKAKEQNAVTEMRKLQNRMKFGEQEEEVGFGDETEGLGMLSQSGSFRALAAVPMPRHLIPASFAARTPATESSATSDCCGVTCRTLAAR